MVDVATAGVVDLAVAAVADAALVAETADEVCFVLPHRDSAQYSACSSVGKLVQDVLCVCHKLSLASIVNLAVPLHLCPAAAGCRSVL